MNPEHCIYECNEGTVPCQSSHSCVVVAISYHFLAARGFQQQLRPQAQAVVGVASVRRCSITKHGKNNIFACKINTAATGTAILNTQAGLMS